MKNCFRVVAAAALLVAGLVGACANDSKSGMTTDDGMSKNGMAEHKMCAKCGMACDANGMCPHCDAGKMSGSTMMK